MQTEANKPTADPFEAGNLVYVRPIGSEEVEDLLPTNALEQLEHTDELFAVHDSDGRRLAIVEGREAAFAAARAHSLEPSSLH